MKIISKQPAPQEQTIPRLQLLSFMCPSATDEPSTKSAIRSKRRAHPLDGIQGLPTKDPWRIKIFYR